MRCLSMSPRTAPKTKTQSQNQNICVFVDELEFEQKPQKPKFTFTHYSLTIFMAIKNLLAFLWLHLLIIYIKLKSLQNKEYIIYQLKSECMFSYILVYSYVYVRRKIQANKNYTIYYFHTMLLMRENDLRFLIWKF